MNTTTLQLAVQTHLINFPENKMLTCIYCKTARFKNDKGSEEHVILSSLGGKKTSRNICCQACNNRLGTEIDEELAKEFSFFSTMLDIKTGRNKTAPTQKNVIKHEGYTYDINPGGSFKLSKAIVTIEDTAKYEEKSISIVANSSQEVSKLFEQALKKFGGSLEDFQKLDGTLNTSYAPTIHRQIALGGEKQLRSITKMMLTYAATLISPERLRNGCFDPAIEYIEGKNSAYDGIQCDYITPFPDQPSLDTINHRIFFITSEKLKLAIGLIEIYGKLRFSAILSKNWEGPSLLKAYAIDPVTQKQSNIDLPISEKIFDFLDQRYMDIENSVNAISHIIQTFQERQSDKVISKILYKALKRHIAQEGSVSKEMIEEFSKEVALEFTKYLFRIESSENINLKN
ncbi:HNH endonuclease [Aquirhabdus sp.]|uniref:HNH endonuclease n=1 Tax=Aquirhabdus sp. TaxID=2824160 RepID=UPI00396C583D